MSEHAPTTASRLRPLGIALAWAWAAVPLAYGAYELIVKVRLLFTG